MVRQAQEEEVYRIPVLGGDNKLRPRRGSAPPVMEVTVLQELRRQNEQANAKTVVPPPELGLVTQLGSHPNIAVGPMTTTPTTSVEMSRESTCLSAPTLITEASDAQSAEVKTVAGSVDGRLLTPIHEVCTPEGRTFSGQSNPSVDGRYGSPHPALAATPRPRNLSNNFDTPQFRRPRGDSLLHRGPANRYAPQHRLNRGPPHYVENQPHGPQGMPYTLTAPMTAIPPHVSTHTTFPTNHGPGYSMPMGHGPQMGAPAMVAMSPSGAMIPVPVQQIGPSMSPYLGPQHSRPLPGQYTENQRPSAHNSGMQYATERMQHQQPAPVMVTPPHGPVNNVAAPFYPLPNMHSQYSYVPPPMMGPQSDPNAVTDLNVANQGTRRASTASDASSGSRARKNPTKSFTDDARVLQSMAEEDLPLHQQVARRRSSASSQSTNLPRSGAGPRRFSREDSQVGFQPPPHVPEAVPVQAMATYPSPPQTYFGYATLDPVSGGLATFEPVHPGYKTSRGKQEVLSALQAAQQPHQSPQVAPQPLQVSPLRKQPARIQDAKPVAGEATQAQVPSEPPKPTEHGRTGFHQETAPHDGFRHPELTSSTSREFEPKKIWIQGKLTSTEALEQLLVPFGHITDISHLRNPQVKRPHFKDCNHTNFVDKGIRYFFVRCVPFSPMCCCDLLISS